MAEIRIGRDTAWANQRSPITDATVSRKHCIITDNGDGTWTLQNLSGNGTLVDGVQKNKGIVRPETVLQMGSLRIKVADLLPIEKKPEQVYSLRHLENVWRQYEQDKIDIQIASAKLANKQRLLSICSTVGMLFYFIEGLGFVRFILMAAAAVGGIYFFLKGINKDNISVVKNQKVDEEYESKYKCPNPACDRYFGYRKFNDIRYTKQCPACGCKYTDK